MYTKIRNYCDKLVTQFDTIPGERKILLKKIAGYVSEKHAQRSSVNLIYVCTHNSRRSHFGQIWSDVAASYFDVKNIHTFSGGTEATAFHINAIKALERIGFRIVATDNSTNPVYHVFHDNERYSVCFSKVYNVQSNPQKEFAAIMTCSEAEDNCPYIPGVELRIGTTYDDPKSFDNTLHQDSKYDERCQQIALETLYIFSKVKI